MNEWERKSIVLDEHTLGVVIGNNLQILRASILCGSPHIQYPTGGGLIHFDPVLLAGRFRLATQQDFDEFRVDSRGHI